MDDDLVDLIWRGALALLVVAGATAVIFLDVRF